MFRNIEIMRMATYIFVEACEHSQSGNYSVEIKAVELYIGDKITKKDYYEICDMLYEHFGMGVLDVNDDDYDYHWELGDFDITIGGGFTLYGDDDYDDEN